MTSHPSSLLDSSEEESEEKAAALDLALQAPPLPTTPNRGSPKRPQPCSSSNKAASLDAAPLKKIHTEESLKIQQQQQPLNIHSHAGTGLAANLAATRIKNVSIRTLAGTVIETSFSNQEEFKDTMIELGGHLENDQGRQIIVVSQLVDHATYHVVGTDRDERQPFDFNTLVRPEKIPLPSTSWPTEFVSENGWMENVLSKIDEGFAREDGLDKERIPPLALVRCSRGGKTRSLLEIAREMQNRNPALAVLFVSFNDISSLVAFEQQDPLQALLRRIVVQATEDYIADSNKEQAFKTFRQQEDIFDPVQFRTWLGQTPAILLVDELNNLKELTQSNSASASVFGDFVKSNFISRASRYMVFSSHIISTLDAFAEYVGQSSGRQRGVVLQSLPRISGLSMAKKIDQKLESVHQVLRCGFIPGLIYDQRPSGQKDAGEKRRKAMQDYNMLASGHPDETLKGLFRSFITGDMDLIPAPLHILFDTIEADEPVMCWVPLHFEYVMRKVSLPPDSPFQVVANKLVQLCQTLFNAKDKSGDGWEAAFVILLLLRCAAHFPDGDDDDDDFLPEYWFKESPQVLYNAFKGEVNDGSQRRMILGECKLWNELVQGIQVGAKPTIVVLFPNNSAFERYDVFALFYQNGALIESHGFQLKEGKNSPSKPPLPDVGRSFVINGRAPVKSDNKPGWRIASADQISRFFGISGERWTPARLESFKKN